MKNAALPVNRQQNNQATQTVHDRHPTKVGTNLETAKPVVETFVPRFLLFLRQTHRKMEFSGQIFLPFVVPKPAFSFYIYFKVSGRD